MMFFHLKLVCYAHTNYSLDSEKPFFQANYKRDASIYDKHVLTTRNDSVAYEKARKMLNFLWLEFGKLKKPSSSRHPNFWLLRQG